MQPIEVGVLGGTGMVGQHFVKFLQNHPWFKLTWIGASDRSAGQKSRDAPSWRRLGKVRQNPPLFKLTWIGASDRSAGKKYRDATSWRLEGGMPSNVADL